MVCPDAVRREIEETRRVALVYVDGDMPLRSVVRQANETVRWYDPQRKAHMEMTVPRDEVMLVGYQSQ